MTPNKYLVAVLLTLTAITLQARSWRINNDMTKAPDFADLNAAMTSDAVVAGDTLYLDPGSNLTAEQNVTKQVTIVGCGFNGAVLPYAYAIISGRLNLKAEGCKIEATYLTNSTVICANHVTIERCQFTSPVSSSGVAQYATIRQCRFDRDGHEAIVGQGRTSTNSAFWTIENSIISAYGNYGKCIYGLYSATIRNNLLIDNNSYNNCNLVGLGNATVTNNIIINYGKKDNAISDCNGQFHHNVISQSYAPDANRITGSTSLDAVYTGDYQSYQLIADSPAAGYGTDGSDCGIFGGLYPYVKGGLPYGHPYYEQAVISARAEADKVKVSLKVKLQDE